MSENLAAIREILGILAVFALIGVGGAVIVGVSCRVFWWVLGRR